MLVLDNNIPSFIPKEVLINIMRLGGVIEAQMVNQEVWEILI